jgi:hypothetical protein
VDLGVGPDAFAFTHGCLPNQELIHGGAVLPVQQTQRLAAPTVHGSSRAIAPLQRLWDNGTRRLPKAGSESQITKDILYFPVIERRVMVGFERAVPAHRVR